MYTESARDSVLSVSSWMPVDNEPALVLTEYEINIRLYQSAVVPCAVL